MSAGFIPMVSTTPPPIDDDDDFGDFHDSNHHDEFGDFSSHVDEDEYSYSSVGTPTGSKSLSFQDDDEITQIKNQHNADDSVFSNNEKDLHREVEIILENNTAEGGKRISDVQSDTDLKAKEQNKQEVNEQVVESELKSDVQSDMDVPVATNVAKVKSAQTDVEVNDSLHNDGDVIKAAIQTNINHVPELPDDGTSKDGLKTANGFSNGSDDESGDWFDTAGSPPPAAEREADPGAELPEDPQPAAHKNTSPSTDSKPDDSPVVVSDDQSSSIEKESPDNAETFGDGKMYDRSSSPSGNETLETSSNDEGASEESDFRAPADVDSTAGTGTETPDKEDTEYETVDHTDIQPATVSDETKQCHDASADFQPAAVDKSDDEEDFGDFSSMRLHTEEKADNVVLADNTEQPASESAPVAFECDFGAFDSAPGGDEGGDGFADFSAPRASVTETDDSNHWNNGPEDNEFGAFGTNDDDFGAFASENDGDDFGEFGSTTAAETWTASSQPIIQVVPVHEKIKNYVSSYSRRKEEDESDGKTIFPLDEKLKTSVQTNLSETHSSIGKDPSGVLRSGDLWHRLEDIDNTIALNFVWNGSGHNKHLLDSLGMHTQNILFSGSKQAYYVPTYYAAGLGMVDPTKGILRPMSAAERITAMSPTEKNAPISNDEAMESTEPHPEWKSVADEHDNGDIMVVESSGSWSTGGGQSGNSGFSESATRDSGSAGRGTYDGPASDETVTPVPIITSSMDLDYLDTIPVARAGTRPLGSSDLLDAELLELTTAPTTEPPPPPKDPGSATLSKILASIKNAGNSSSSSSLTTLNSIRDTSKWEEEESKLSQEARAVLQRLPDLSFMKSKVLVFPMNFPGVNLSDDPS